MSPREESKLSCQSHDSPDDGWPAVKVLETLLVSPDATQRLIGVLALKTLVPSAKNAPQLLKKALGDRDYVVRAAAVLAMPAAEHEAQGNVAQVEHQIRSAIEAYKGTSDSAHIIRLYILVSAMTSQRAHEEWPNSLEQTKHWVRKTVNEMRLSREDVPALVDAINLSAQVNLGFTEPFNRLCRKLQNVVHDSNDPLLALIACNRLGMGVPSDFLYWPAIQQQWVQLLAKVPVEFLIFERQRRIQQQQSMIGQQKEIVSFLNGFSWLRRKEAQIRTRPNDVLLEVEVVDPTIPGCLSKRGRSSNERSSQNGIWRKLCDDATGSEK